METHCSEFLSSGATAITVSNDLDVEYSSGVSSTICDDAVLAIHHLEVVIKPVEMTKSSNGTARVTTVLVGSSVPAASHNSMNTNSSEWTCETVITKASGPYNCEAVVHAHCENPSSIVTGVPAGSGAGAVSYWVTTMLTE